MSKELGQLNDEEFQKWMDQKTKEYPKHHRKLNEITSKTFLQPNEVIEIAKKYHKEKGLDGIVNEDIQKLEFDEEYTFRTVSQDESDRYEFKLVLKDKKDNGKRPSWRVQVDLLPNRFFDEFYTIIISDPDKKVMDMLDPSMQPVNEGNEFTDKDIEYIMSDED